MRILVTGPTGFIGSAFSRLALDRGHEVAGLIRPERAARLNPKPSGPQAWLAGTLAQPPWNEIAAFQPEACVHTAWIATPGEYLQSSDNFLWRDWSLEFLARLARLTVKHLLVLGTCAEYAPSRGPMSETQTPIVPASVYARCKNELRIGLESSLCGTGTQLGWARLFYPYGIGEHPARLCTSVIEQVRRGERACLQTPSSIRDYIYRDDVAEALLVLVERQVRGPVNVGTGQGVAIATIAHTIARLLDRPDLVAATDDLESAGADLVVADVNRLRALGWQPRVPLETGLKKLIDSLSG